MARLSTASLIDADAAEWHYFAQGKANVLLASDNPQYLGKLLRLRLATTTRKKNSKPKSNKVPTKSNNNTNHININKKGPTHHPTTAVYQFVESKIRPLLGDFVVPMELVPLSRAFLENVNSMILGKLQSHFDSNDKELKVALDEQFGLLVVCCLPVGSLALSTENKFAKLYGKPKTADSANNNNNDNAKNNMEEYILELKPKWLYKDLNTAYCRNCASVKHHRKIKNHQQRVFCPLGLVSNKQDILKTSVSDIMRSFPVAELLKIELGMVLFHYLKDAELKDNVLQLLEKYQNLGNNKKAIRSLSSIRDVNEELLLGMALRDVSIFFSFTKVPVIYNCLQEGEEDQQAPVTKIGDLTFIVNIGDNKHYQLHIRVVDIDLKARDKWQYWRDSELELLNSGSYNNIDSAFGQRCAT